MSLCRKNGNVGQSVKSELVVMDGTMNQQVCRRVLQQSFLPWVRATFQNNFVLVQGNAPPYIARTAMEFPENQGVEVMDWSS